MSSPVDMQARRGSTLVVMSQDDLPAPSAPRRRDAAATRAAILHAAREEFTERGYDGVGVREIAGAARVDSRLVSR